MNSIFSKICLLFLISTLISEAVGDVKINNLNIEGSPNEYFGEIVSAIKPEANDSTISVSIPIKKNLDENLQITINLNFNNLPILRNHTITLCEAIAEDGYFKPIIEKIQPAGKFPKQCPIPAGTWKLTDYVIDLKDYLPFGFLPTGNFDLQLDFGLPGAKSLIKVTVDGSVTFGTSNSPLDFGSIFKLF